MHEISRLKKTYTSVAGSFGGSQLYFSNCKRPFSRFKKAAGCGVVALGDVIAYLKSQSFFKNKEEYIKYFNKTARKLLWIPNNFGISFVQETIGFANAIKKEHLPYRCRWCFSKRKLYPRVLEMLNNDTPVILCIPKTFGVKKDQLAFYNAQLSRVCSTSGHFVVITGIHSAGNDIFFEISSWGNKYYINLKEYILFQKRHLMGLLGNIIYVKKK